MPTERSAYRVFVVDDDPGLLYLLTFSLSADGHVVDPFDQGGEVCARAAREQPDVIVLDVMLPDRDGLGILHELKGDPATCDIPVVLLTAEASDAEVWEAWVAGADYCLTKPFDPDELARYLDRLGRVR